MWAKLKIKNRKLLKFIYLRFFKVELQGIEPWSKHIRYKPSTCLVIHCLSEETRGITNQFSS